jgi:hypothetical protein
MHRLCYSVAALAMNIEPYIKDLDALSVKVGWLHPQVPQSSRSDIETALIAMRAAVDTLVRVQSKLKEPTVDPEMIKGEEVLVKLYGDNHIYYGRVLRPKKMEVELPEYNIRNHTNFEPNFVADENSIEEWKRP